MASAFDTSLVWGVGLAFLGAVLIAFGTHIQSAGLRRVVAHGERPSLIRLALNGTWLTGSLLLCAAIGLQLAAVGMATVSLVQPVGIIALFVSMAIRYAMDRQLPRPKTVLELVFCVGAVVGFVLVAGKYTAPSRFDERTAIVLCAVFALALVALAAVNRSCGERHPLVPVVGAATLFGFVITLMKLVLSGTAQFFEGGRPISWSDVPLLLCACAAVVGFSTATTLLQTAHRVARADTVLAGLTVIDPLVAAFLGILLLGELASAPLWVLGLLLIPTTVAFRGVIVLSRISQGTTEPAERPHT